jgi:hypothetical protein
LKKNTDVTMGRINKKPGRGAIVSAPFRFLHPSAEIQKRYSNTYQTGRLEGIEVLGLVPGQGSLTGFTVHHLSHRDVQDLPNCFQFNPANVKVV